MEQCENDEWEAVQQDRLDDLWDAVQELEADEADDMQRRREEYLHKQAALARHRRAAMDLSIRAMAGELLAELSVNGNCTAGRLAEELAKLVPPLPQTEYRLAVETKALLPTDCLRDHVADGAELTALVVASIAGEYFCQAGASRGITLCLELDRRALCQIERNVGGLSFFHRAEGFWEEPDAEANRVQIVLDQSIGNLDEFVVRHTLEMEKMQNGDLRVVKSEINGGGQLDPNMLMGCPGNVFSRF
mmetsp:Transcript_57078/g.107072  ORF Transcript_57078/g.107072 Transcript_57078/m.107072 type:complete len:247 (+) Transcript_57078:34-774(+)